MTEQEYKREHWQPCTTTSETPVIAFARVVREDGHATLRYEVEKIANDTRWFGTPCARAIGEALEATK